MASFGLLKVVSRASSLLIRRPCFASVPRLALMSGNFQTVSARYVSDRSEPTSGNKPTSSDSSSDKQVNDVKTRIKALIEASDKNMFVFMKGTPQEPMCRYSGMVVQILDAYGFKYDSFNVLDDADIRQGIKDYSNWPTIPQVYKDRTFIGGCDILLQMHQSGELKKMVNLPE